MKPFRWDLSKPEQLGSLVNGWQEVRWSKNELHQIRSVSANVIAASSGVRIIFLGRSPELFYDYLCGQFHATEIYERLILANISFHNLPNELSSFKPKQRDLLASFLDKHQLSPRALTTRPVLLVDYVSSGATFSVIFKCITELARKQNLDVKRVQGNLRFLGLVARTKNSPNTFRWYQHMTWANQVKREQLKSLSVDADFIHFLANSDDKVTPSFVHWRWQKARDISRSTQNLAALRRSFSLYKLANTKNERMLFKRELNKQFEHARWFKQIVQLI